MSIDQNMMYAIATILATFGLVLCFYGHRFFKTMLLIAGCLAGAFFSYQVANNYLEHSGLIWGLTLAGALLGMLLLFTLYAFSVMFFGGLLGLVIAYFSATLLNQSEPDITLLIACVVIFAIVAIIFEPLVLKLSTAFTGAWLTTECVGYFFMKNPSGYAIYPPQNDAIFYTTLITCFVLGLSGFIFQYNKPATQVEINER